MLKQDTKKVKLVEYSTEKDTTIKCDCDPNECSILEFYKERTEYLEDLVKKYKFDYLTGLMGKLDYSEKAAMLFEEYKFANQDFFFIMVDIDDLHNMNRMHGYHYGDEVIKETANKLREFYEFHQVYRVSGDEFVILVRSYHTTEEAIRENLESIEGITFVIDNACGYTNPKHMFKAADKKLSEMKKNNKRM